MRMRWKITGAAAGLVLAGMAIGTLGVHAQGPSAKPDPSKSSYLPVVEEEFRTVFARMSAAKASITGHDPSRPH